MNLEDIRNSLPKNLASVIGDCDWREILVGCSSAKVFRLTFPNRNAFYLKTASHRSPLNSLLPEKSKLEWLKNKLPVPEILMFAKNKDTEFLLLSEIAGRDASGDFFKTAKRETIAVLADALKMVHALPVKNCPFDARLNYKIELAQERLENNLVDQSDFDETRTGRTAEDLFGELIETKPNREDLVFTHGDFCLPNVILENGKLGGFIDWGNAGVADKYQDIALLARSVESNFGSKWVDFLFERLNIELDAKKIKFYTLLDEFF